MGEAAQYSSFFPLMEESMALLTNDDRDAGYLAVELTVDKQLEPVTPFARGPVISWICRKKCMRNCGRR